MAELGRIRDFTPEGEPPVVLMSLGLILIVAAFFALVVNLANKRWDKQEASE